jgi:hypothetical protein
MNEWMNGWTNERMNEWMNAGFLFSIRTWKMELHHVDIEMETSLSIWLELPNISQQQYNFDRLHSP